MSKKRFVFLVVIIFTLLVLADWIIVKRFSVTSFGGFTAFILFLLASLLPSATFAVLYPSSVRIRSRRGVLLILLFSLNSFLFGLTPLTFLFKQDGPNNYSFFSFYFLQLRIPIWYPIFLIFFLISLWMVRVVIPSLPQYKNKR